MHLSKQDRKRACLTNTDTLCYVLLSYISKNENYSPKIFLIASNTRSAWNGLTIKSFAPL